MVLAQILESLGSSVDRARSGGSADFAAVAAALEALRNEAQKLSYASLAQAADAASAFVRTWNGGDARKLFHHVAQICEYAANCERSGPEAARTLLAPVLPGSYGSATGAVAADTDDEMVRLFVLSCLSALADLEAQVLEFDHGTDHEETVAAMRRTIHTMKGESGVLSLAGIQKLCHEMESTLDVCMDKSLKFPADLMLELVDWIRDHVERLAADHATKEPSPAVLLAKIEAYTRSAAVHEPGERLEVAATPAGVKVVAPRIQLVVNEEYLDTLNDFLNEAKQHLADAESAMLEYESSGRDIEHINRAFRAFHTIKGVSGFMNLAPIVKVAHAAETVLDGVRSERHVPSAADVDLILASGDLIKTLLESIGNGSGPYVADVEAHVQKLAAVTASKAELAAAKPTPVAVPTVPASPVEKAPAVAEQKDASAAETTVAVVPPARKDAAPAPVARNTKQQGADNTIKVSTQRLDALVDMVGELVIAQSMVLQDTQLATVASQALSRNIAQVGKITRDLQEAAMSLRMVTLKSTFQKMARLVRDVAVKAGKKVDLHLEGEDTELDRTVVDEIHDPLVHMIRNSVDHGIEAPDKRRAAGKPEVGVLTLRAYHQGGSILIEIADDGGGIRRDKVVAKAVERSLLPPGTEPKDLKDTEIFNLIFLPGFSTAEKVTDISGRGVGMDVVRRNIEALRGKIEIESGEGRGTTFKMRLPLTLAIIDGMVVRVGAERYVIPTLAIEQSFRPDRRDLHYLQDTGEVVHVRGSVLPVYRLKTAFGLTSGVDDVVEGILIVLEVDGTRACLLVDEILGQQQVVIKSLNAEDRSIRGVSGGAIMGDGRIALIVDVAGLVETAVLAANT